MNFQENCLLKTMIACFLGSKSGRRGLRGRCGRRELLGSHYVLNGRMLVFRLW